MIKTLHKSILAACPINGVSIGNVADKSTWRIDFHQSATQDQKINAMLAVAKFDAISVVAKEKADADADMSARAELRNESTLKLLQSMSPSQAKAWVNSTVTSFQDSKDLLGIMAAIVCVLSRSA